MKDLVMFRLWQCFLNIILNALMLCASHCSAQNKYDLSHFPQAIDLKSDIKSLIWPVQVHVDQQSSKIRCLIIHTCKTSFSHSWILGNKTASFPLGMEELQQITRTVVIFERESELDDSRVVRYLSNELNSEG